ncbi:MAG: WecB/TagA/CpsF family glycosyltransferase [Acidimicrobiales bacterium]
MRATWLDWQSTFLDACATHEWRIYYIGGTEASLAGGLDVLRSLPPGLIIDGHHGYFDHAPDSAESRAVVAAANAFEPSLVFVGMGMPLQELWSAAQRPRLSAPVVVAIGAGLDYASGAIQSPPRWAGRLGLEWLYRLVAEPRRLGYRYLVEPFWLLGWSVADSVRQRRP